MRNLKPLPQNRPQIVPAAYGKHNDQRSWGLFVTNPGYMALDVHIPSVVVGGSGYKLNFHGQLTQLGERDHREFFETSVEHPKLDAMAANCSV